MASHYTTPEERLAHLETMSENGAKDREDIKQDLTEVKANQEALCIKVDEIHTEISKAKGALGVALWVISSMGFVLVTWGEKIWKALGGGSWS